MAGLPPSPEHEVTVLASRPALRLELGGELGVVRDAGGSIRLSTHLEQRPTECLGLRIAELAALEVGMDAGHEQDLGA